MAPNKRVEAIQKFSTRMTSKREVVDELEKWGMQLNPSIKTLKGRLLAPEKVYLKTEYTYHSSNADWGNSKYIFQFD